MLTTRTDVTSRSLPAPRRRSDGCPQCSGRIIDAGEEFVCSSCGAVTQKEVIDEGWTTTMTQARHPLDYSRALGSFLGPAEYGYEEIFSKGFSKTPSTFKYLKTISDFSGSREAGGTYSCARLIERVCEKLGVPRAVAGEAVSIAREVIQVRERRSGFTIASVSAYSVISACKIQGVTSVGVKEVVETHRDLGYRVKTSTLIQLAIDSPIRVHARRPEEYLGAVLARLPDVHLSSGAVLPSGYLNRLHRVAKLALESVDGPSRGGHNPRALAATSVYAADVAIATVEGRRRYLSQRDIATCVEAAEYTLREQFVEIFKERMETICGLVTQKESQIQPQSSQTYQRPLESPPRSA